MAGKEHKKVEFSKILVAWAMILTTACIATSYVLAYMYREPCTDITIAVVSTCIAIAVSYEAKSYGEKNSRNKYGIDADGNRLPNTQNDKDEPAG